MLNQDRLSTKMAFVSARDADGSLGGAAELPGPPFDAPAIGQRIVEAMKALRSSGRTLTNGANVTKQQIENSAELSSGLLSRITSPAGYGETSAKKLFDIARALGVRFEWLVTGEGPMFHGGTVVEGDARYPNFTAAARCARELGYMGEAIDAVQAVVGFKSDNDLTAQEWFEQIQAAELDLRRGRKPRLIADVDVDAEVAKNHTARAEPPPTQPSLQERLAAVKAELGPEKSTLPSRRGRKQ